MSKTMTQTEANQFVKSNVVILVNGTPFVDGSPVLGKVVASRLRRAFEMRNRGEL